MSYGDLTTVRVISGLTEAKIATSVLEVLRDLAENQMLIEITGSSVNEELTGVKDGTNLNYTVDSPPIADSNFDKVVDKTDIAVYTWTDKDDESTKSLATISAIYPKSGLIVLASAPSSDVEKLTADYNFYFDKIPDFGMVDMATNFLTAYLAMVRLRGALPEKYALGRLRVTSELPGRAFFNEYRNLITQIRAGLVGRAGSATVETRVGKVTLGGLENGS